MNAASHEQRLASIAHLAEDRDSLLQFASGHVAVSPVAQLMVVDNKAIYVPKMEHGILMTVASRPGELVVYEELFIAVWGTIGQQRNEHSQRKTAHVQVGTLLRRMGSPYDDPHSRVIQTIRDKGLLAVKEYPPVDLSTV